MMKKLIAGVGTLAFVVVSATPALAWGWHHSSSDVTNVAFVNNSSEANANTGRNMQLAGAGVLGGQGDTNVVAGNGMLTGTALAVSEASVEANNNTRSCCQVHGRTTNTALIGNESTANANTGRNLQGVVAGTLSVGRTPSWGMGGHHGHDDTNVVAGNLMSTGNAQANSDAWVVVNSTVSPM